MCVWYGYFWIKSSTSWWLFYQPCKERAPFHHEITFLVLHMFMMICQSVFRLNVKCWTAIAGNFRLKCEFRFVGVLNRRHSDVSLPVKFYRLNTEYLNWGTYSLQSRGISNLATGNAFNNMFLWSIVFYIIRCVCFSFHYTRLHCFGCMNVKRVYLLI